MEKREKWEMDLLIDGSSPAVVGGGGGKRARGGGESEGEGEAPRKVSPSVGRKERVPSGVEVMELDDDEEEEVQVVQPGPSKFKPLTTSASKPNAPATTAEDTHCYLVRLSLLLRVVSQELTSRADSACGANLRPRRT